MPNTSINIENQNDGPFLEGTFSSVFFSAFFCAIYEFLGQDRKFFI